MFLIAAVLSLVNVIVSGNSADFSQVPFSPEKSKEISRLTWSAFTESAQPNKPALFRNSFANVEVDTPLGTVQGILTESCRLKKPYAAFFGMPYAKPPVGPLRFKAPIEVEPWTEKYDATFERPSCLQFAGRPELESEDCLYINVYTPNVNLSTKLLPVMFYIYGGAFITGSSNSSVYAPDFIVEKDVVLVTFNYRLGALGFLSLQTEDIPGNAGLKDQVMALKWVKKNIETFGGDPNSVTIFGESAGSASVNYHVLSEVSKPYFHRAIMESGTATAPWAFVPSKETRRIAGSLAKKVGCPTSPEKEFSSCLRNVPATVLSEKQQSTLALADMMVARPFAFVPTAEPVHEGAFITEEPYDILLHGSYTPVPSIIGSNNKEGLIVLPALKESDPLGVAVSLIGFDLSIFYPYQLKEKLGPLERRVVHNKFRSFYFENKPIGLFTRDKLLDLVTDSSFTMPIQQMAALMANKSTAPIYNYLFNYDGDYGLYKKKLHISEPGACHGDELGYLFYDESFHPSYDSTVNSRAEEMVQAMTTFWSNFAKTGDPTPTTASRSKEKWLPCSLDRLSYMEIGENIGMRDRAESELTSRIDFWYSLVTSSLVGL